MLTNHKILQSHSRPNILKLRNFSIIFILKKKHNNFHQRLQILLNFLHFLNPILSILKKYFFIYKISNYKNKTL